MALSLVRRMSSTRLFVALAALAIGVVAFAPSAAAQEVLERLQNEYRALYDRTHRSVVVVSDKPYDKLTDANPLLAAQQGVETNAGWVFNDRYVVTSVENALGTAITLGKTQNYVEALGKLRLFFVITPDGKSYECVVQGFDLSNLLLVLRLPEGVKLPSLRLAAEAPPIGSTVAALGNSFDSILADAHVSFAVGSLSDAYRMEPFDLDEDGSKPGDPYRGLCYEFEGAGNPGDWGGPLVNLNGEVVGMLCAHYNSGRRLPTAVPAMQFKPALEQIVGGKEITRGSFGFYVSKTGRDDYPIEGVILSVTAGTSAARVGLARGDEIVMIDGYRVNGYDQILQSIGTNHLTARGLRESQTVSYGAPAGTVVQITVRRDGKLHTYEIAAGGSSTLPSKPVSADEASPSLAGASATAGAIFAEAKGEHLVQVIADWRRRAETLPAGQGAEELGQLGALMGRQDPLFFDMRLGPYTGVVTGADGEILISEQVLGEFTEGNPGGVPNDLRQLYVVLPDGRTFTAAVTGRNQQSGLAMLKIDAKGLSPIAFAESPALKSGGLLTVATRSNNPFLVSSRAGVVSATTRGLGGEFQLDARIGSCDLGGVVLDSAGAAVGVIASLPVSSVGKASGVANAVYGHVTVAKALESLRKGEFLRMPPQPFLGVGASPAFANRPGLRVGSVTRGSAASRAGVREGDILLEVDGQLMSRTTDLVKVIQAKKVGDVLSLKLERDGEAIEVTATLGARPVG